jgi:hypothetical protein
MTEGVFIPRFPLGQVVMTRGVMQFCLENSVDSEDLTSCLRRHQCGDWGNMCDEDKQTNNEAVRYGNRVMSEYSLQNERIWVITEHDRSVTTILLPEEY